MSHDEAGPRCPLCSGPGRLAFVKDGFTHHLCRGCDSLFVEPMPSPTELADFYRRHDADQNSRLCWEGGNRHAHAAWARALAAAERLAGPGPLLDVGCGAGQFLAFARARGWSQLVGLELAPEAAALARRASGAEVHEATLEGGALPEGGFAVVTLWDVLEHLPDPGQALDRLGRLLRPGGLLMLGVPHRHGITLRAFGAGSLIVMPPEHLFLPSRRGLLAAIRRAGLEPLRAETTEVRLREWLDAARRWLGRGGRAVPRAGAGERADYLRLYGRITGAGAFGLVQGAANLVLRLTRLGDQLTLIVRRPAVASRAAAGGEARP
jgi:2-polyprenyl-3-methyl-5-hydroxy-6-metoxy-1,4-benzoquinol methylase